MPEGRDDVVIASPVGAMTSERAADLLCTGFEASVTVAVKFAVPLTVGVPEMTPVEGERARPVGRLPEVMDQV